MEVVKMSEVPREPRTGRRFTGTGVTRQPLVSNSKEYEINNLNFPKGVRTKFHAHESDQTLIVTAGTGMVATEQEERVVTVGDVIFIPAGEKHWHGATKDLEFSHIFIIRPGYVKTLTLLED